MNRIDRCAPYEFCSRPAVWLASPFLVTTATLFTAFALLTAIGCAPLVPDDSGPTDMMEDGADNFDPNEVPVTDGNWTRPALDATWQWQLQPNANGNINTTYDVNIYDIDLFDVPASLVSQLQSEGRIVIAYFSAGTFEDFRSDAGEFAQEEIGNPLDDFPNERWLDIRSSNVRRIMQDRLDLAVQKGFDGVEPDNVTGFSNDSGFTLTVENQLGFNRFIANEAHRRGLAVALKNDLEQIPQLVEYFDFAVNEQCHEFDECDTYAPFINTGKPVLSAEYADQFVDSPDERNALCELANKRGLRTLILPIDLDDAFRFACSE